MRLTLWTLWTGIPAQGGRSSSPTVKADRALILAGLALLHGIALALLAMQRITMQQAEMTLGPVGEL